MTKNGEETLIDGKFKLDLSTQPRQILITATSRGIAIQVTLRGIYKIEADRLTIGLGPRTPKEFTTKMGDGTKLMMLERIPQERR